MSGVSRVMFAGGVVLLVAAAIVAISGGVQIALGPVSISATSATRILFEAAVLLLLAEVTRVEWRAAPLFIALAFVLVSAASDSSIRRVGDGFEYLAMADNLSKGEPASLTRADFAAVTSETAAHGNPGWDTTPLEWLRGSDGRYDFPHFWLYSLGAAPLVAVARALGLHPALAFTVLNIVLLLGATWALLRAGAGFVAVLLAVTVLWWIDKAHAEIFIVTMTGMALVLRDMAPRASLLLLGAAAAQMPILVVVLVASVAAAIARHGRRVIGAAVVGVAIAAAYPLYYLWRLDITSPLAETVMWHVPAMSEVLTPIIDPNLGIAWFSPVLILLTGVGIVAAARSREWVALGLLCLGLGTILVAGTQTPNVNHGGTPGMSRYGVWLLGFVLPFAVRGERSLASTRPIAYAVVVSMAVIMAALMLHPRFGDAGTRPSPTRLAELVWTRAPFLDNPLPEVFAERVGHIDGPAPAPVATEGCEKALVIGTGTDVSWPQQCAPRPAPPQCVEIKALCYVSGANFTLAPKQPGFSPVAAIPQ